MTEKIIPAIRSSRVRHEIVAGCRLTNLEETREAYGLSYATDDYKKILSDPQIDAVFVALPDPRLQEKISTAALLQGKHVFVEKPVSLSKTAVVRLAGLSAKSGLVTCEGFNLIHLPSMDLLRGKLESHDLDKISINCSIQDRGDDGLMKEKLKIGLYFAFIHSLSVANNLLGAPVQIDLVALQLNGPHYSLRVKLCYSKNDTEVILNFNNKSPSGFEFKIDSYADNEPVLSIDATRKAAGRASEKQLSYARQIDRFLLHALSGEPFEGSFVRSISIYDALETIFNRIENDLDNVSSALLSETGVFGTPARSPSTAAGHCLGK
jgi:predicted dehydrogenase